jgi:FkbM family methyltransferase
LLSKYSFFDNILEFTSSFSGDCRLFISNNEIEGDTLFFSHISLNLGMVYRIEFSHLLNVEILFLKVTFSSGGEFINVLNVNELLNVEFPYDDNVKASVPKYGKFSFQFSQRPNHEIGFRRITTQLIKSGFINGNMIDLGAWIGDNSIPWALMQPNLVYAIDPSVENINYINEIAGINGCNNLVTIQDVICDAERLLTTNNDLHHAEFAIGSDGVTSIKSKSLDMIYDEGRISNVSFIHLDVEGMEFLVFQGAMKLVSKYRPICCYEQHLDTDDVSGLVKFLSDTSYISFIINESLPGCRPDCRNIFAFPAERYDFIYKAVLEKFINDGLLLAAL